MKFLVSEIKKNAYASPFMFEESIDISELKELNKDIREIKNVNVHGSCHLEGENDIVFSLTISGELILPCARTLVDVPYPYEIKEVIVFSESNLLDEEDNDVIPVEGEEIDLTPIVKEHVLLAVPFRVFTEDKEVLENAVLEGDGWELTFEEDEEKRKAEKIDPRLKKLQSLLKENNEE